MSHPLEQSLKNILGDKIISNVSMPMPSPKQENWRHAGLSKLPILLDETEVEETPVFENIIDNYIVFEGSTPIKSSHKFKSISKKTNAQLDYFSELNQHIESDAIEVHIPENEKLQLEIIHTDCKEKDFSAPGIIVNCGKGSKLEIIERYLYGKTKIATNSIHFEIAENAHAEHIKLIENAQTTFTTNTTTGSLGRDSSYRQANISMNGTMIRNHVTINLKGENATAAINGSYITKDSEQVENYTYINHDVAHTFSNQLYKGLLDDESRAVFSGQIKIHNDAQQINSEQLNKNLILNDKARIFTQPQLVIGADDVKCSHGATVGKMDEEELFYLQSRGIEHKRAKQLLTQAFVYDVLDHFQINTMVEFTKKKISNVLSTLPTIKGSL